MLPTIFLCVALGASPNAWAGTAARIQSSGNLNIPGGINAEVIISASTDYVFGIRSSWGNTTIGNGINANVSATNTYYDSLADAFGIYGRDYLTISGGISGDVSANSHYGDGAYGLFAASIGMTITGDITGDITATSRQGYATGLHAARPMTINGDIAGDITATVTAGWIATGLSSTYDNINITGEIRGNVRASATDFTACGINAYKNLTIGSGISGAIEASALSYATGIESRESTYITGGISGRITASATENYAYGIKADENITIKDGISGEISVTAGTDNALGISAKGALNGGDADTPLVVTSAGTISATSDNLAVAIAAAGGMNLDISGTLSGTDNSNRGYAIRSGYRTNPSTWVETNADDTVLIRTNANLIGKIDLSEGTDRLILTDAHDHVGQGILSSQVSNHEYLIKNGTGKWTLTENQTLGAAGQTIINQGILAVNATLTSASVTVEPAGKLTGTGVINGTVLNKGVADGNFTINGNMDNSGEFRGNGVVSGGLTNTGKLIGDLTINGVLANDGALVVNSEIIGIIENTGVISGTGVLNGRVTNSGVIAPGNSIGTLSFNGDYISNTSSTLQIEVDDAGNSDKVIVQGDATLDGTLNIIPEQGDYEAGTTYTILEANAVNGTFHTLKVDGLVSETLHFEVTYNPDQTVGLTIARTPFEEVLDIYFQNTGKQNARVKTIAAYIDRVTSNSSGDMADIIGLLDFMSLEQMEQAFGQMLPNNTQAVQQTTIHVGSLFTSSTNEHLFTMRSAARAFSGGQRANLSQRPMLAQGKSYEISPARFSGLSAGDAVAKQSKETPWNLYARYIGNFGQLKRDDWGNKTSWQANGVDVGLDLLLSPNIILGANFGFTNSTISVDNVASENSYIDSYRAGLYSTYFDKIDPEGKWGEWYVDASLGYALNANKIRRRILFTGVDRVAKAEFNSNALLAHLGAGYEYQWKGLSVGPIASLDYMNLWNPKYSEHGAQDLNLTVSATTQHSLQSGLGVRLAYAISNTTQPGWFTPEIRAEWRHEYLNDNQKITASMQGNPYGKFSVTGPSVDTDTARLGGGFTASLGKYVEAKALYQADISENALTHGINASLQINF